jgi:phospholipid/cholesterol/gamma-HCH transport system ATP-binding protein
MMYIYEEVRSNKKSPTRLANRTRSRDDDVSMIILDGVGVSFNKSEPLLSNVNLAVRRGETFVLVGSSGSGKSVLLKTIAGLIRPTSGNVRIDNLDLYHSPRKERAKVMERMGMLFQKNALFDSFTVSENLEFPLREVGGHSESEIKEKAKTFLGYVGLSHAAQLYPDEISGGMQKRVGIARALILNPEIILYDDPTAGLDPITSRIIVDLIIRLNKEFGTTVVAITNDMNRAYQMATRMGMILEGSLLVTGTVEETKNYKDERVQNFIHGVFKEPAAEANA